MDTLRSYIMLMVNDGGKGEKWSEGCSKAMLKNTAKSSDGGDGIVIKLGKMRGRTKLGKKKIVHL